jgi:hypothetical protein
MRSSLGLVLVLCASGCVCTPLSEYCGPSRGVACPSEAYEIAEGLRAAERAWLTGGACTGPVVGTTTRGTWVNSGVPDFCGEQLYFDRSGALIGVWRGCEGQGTDYGIGLRIQRGPVTRYLCTEARRRLVLRGVLLGFMVERVLGGDGRSVRPEGKVWRVPFGSWTARLPDDAGQLSFSVAEEHDGGLSLSDASLDATPLEAQAFGRWYLAEKGSIRRFELGEWVELPAGD